MDLLSDDRNENVVEKNVEIRSVSVLGHVLHEFR